MKRISLILFLIFSLNISNKTNTITIDKQTVFNKFKLSILLGQAISYTIFSAATLKIRNFMEKNSNKYFKAKNGSGKYCRGGQIALIMNKIFNFTFALTAGSYISISNLDLENSSFVQVLFNPIWNAILLIIAKEFVNASYKAISNSAIISNLDEYEDDCKLKRLTE